MMTSLRTHIVPTTFLALFAGSLACGGGSGGVPLQDLDNRFEEALCEMQVECNLYPDMQTCRDNFYFVEGSDLSQLQADVDAGRVDYDSGMASQCIDSYADLLADCEIFGGEGYDSIESICDAVFTGNVELGGDCYTDEECAGEADCDRSCQEQCCTGVCVEAEPAPEPVGIGEDCSDADCVDGAWCKYDSTSQTSTCEAVDGEGEACEGLGIGSCGDGLVCDGYPEGTCKRPAEQGATCDPALGYGFYSCIRLDNWCDPADTTCKPRPGVGEDCSVEVDNCADYAYCGSDGKCVMRPGLDEACGGTQEIACLGDLDCLDQVCVAPEPEPVCD